MTLAFFYEWKDARIWGSYNSSLDMHLNHLAAQYAKQRRLPLLPHPTPAPSAQNSPPVCSCWETAGSFYLTLCYSPWGLEESDMTKRLSTYTHTLSLINEDVQGLFY